MQQANLFDIISEELSRPGNVKHVLKNAVLGTGHDSKLRKVQSVSS